MKKISFLLLLTTITIYSCNNMQNNPLLSASDAPYGAPRFDQIANEHYMAAFTEAIHEARNDIEAITSNREVPTFDNTIKALEFAGDKLTNVNGVFFNLNEANTNDTMQQIALDVTPLITAYINDVSLNEALFARVKSVYEDRATLNLPAEDSRLLEKTFKGFARGGANLSKSDKQRYREVTEKLSNLTLVFGQNVLAATNAFIMTITDSTDLEGLPDYVIDMGAAESKERGLAGWTYTLQTPSFVPFMQHSAKRELREKLWRAYNSKCISGENDNTVIVKEIVNLRLEKANLLGYATHADFVLEERMAKDKNSVKEFLATMVERSKPHAVKEIKEVADYANKIGFTGSLMPWDFSYYSEKLKQDRYALNDELLKPYFKLESVQDGVFMLADKLYGLTFSENKDIPTYHQDVKAYDVSDSSGRHMAVLYLDYFPRESKRSGAWMTSFREQNITNSVENRPLVSIVCNFTKPTENTPSLLTFNEVSTLLHEFGHALHGIFAEGQYASLTGTNVPSDFVELPSQIMENWGTEKEFLNLWATHYQSGEAIPEELIQKIIDAKNYLSGYSSIRQLTFGINDMQWHTLSEPFAGDIIAFEKNSIKDCALLPTINDTSISTAMTHIFSGGYSAGYYSYKWAEVLEADAFSLFLEKGIFDKEVAASFRENILSKGSIYDAMDMYINFRGHKPQMEALLKKLGLTE